MIGSHRKGTFGLTDIKDNKPKRKNKNKNNAYKGGRSAAMLPNINRNKNLAKS